LSKRRKLNRAKHRRTFVRRDYISPVKTKIYTPRKTSRIIPTTAGVKTKKKKITENAAINATIVNNRLPCLRERRKIRRAYFGLKVTRPHGLKGRGTGAHNNRFTPTKC
jgi:hypothetical protein